MSAAQYATARAGVMIINMQQMTRKAQRIIGAIIVITSPAMSVGAEHALYQACLLYTSRCV